MYIVPPVATVAQLVHKPSIPLSRKLLQSIKNLKNTPYVGLSSLIRRRSRSLGSGHKGCFEQMSFEMFPECLNSKTKAVSALSR